MEKVYQTATSDASEFFDTFKAVQVFLGYHPGRSHRRERGFSARTYGERKPGRFPVVRRRAVKKRRKFYLNTMKLRWCCELCGWRTGDYWSLRSHRCTTKALEKWKGEK